MQRRIDDGEAKKDYVKPNMISFAQLSDEERKKDVDQLTLAVRFVEEYIQKGKR